MKKGTINLLMVLLLIFSFAACSKVPAGNVGVKVYLLGGSKGVDHEVLGVGRYWIGWNEELFLFPTFTQNYVWTKDKNEQSETDESVTFQTKEGLDVNTDIGISYHIIPDKIGMVFQKYRKGIDEITGVYLRNMVRDAFIQVGAKNPVESVYGEGKTAMMSGIQELVKKQVEEIGIVIEKVYLVGSMRLPPTVITALNEKISATQKAQQRENELREAEAAAKKVVATAEGEAQSVLKKAEAQSKANRMLAESITTQLVQYEAVKRWDGILPKVGASAGIIPMVNLEDTVKK